MLCVLAALFLVSCGQEEVNNDKTQVTPSPVKATLEPQESPAPTVSPSPVPTPTLTPQPVDTTAPVLEGVQDITILRGEPVLYRKGVSVWDDSEEEPMLQIDTSQVDMKTAGSYPVIYRAVDGSGNETIVEITLVIMEPPSVEEVAVKELATELLAKLITEEMTEYDKVYTLWNWCRKNIRYSYTSGDRSSVWAGAYEGLHGKMGDCYAYYATLEVLLNEIGIENMCVARVGGESNHWWNLVKVDGQWYHCDASPRSQGDHYKCFLQTDAQLQAYTEWNRKKDNYYTFDETLYPPRATEILYGKTPEKIRSTPHTTPAPAVTPEPILPPADVAEEVPVATE